MATGEICVVCGEGPQVPKRRLCAACLKKEAHENYMKHRDRALARAKEKYHSRTAEQIAADHERYLKYFEKHKDDPEFRERRRAQSRKYYAKHRVACNAAAREHYYERLEERRAYGREYYRTHQAQFAVYRATYKAKRDANRPPRVPASSKPCSHCHKAPRHRDTSWCAECLAEYQHNYYLQHRGNGRRGRVEVMVEAAAKAV